MLSTAFQQTCIVNAVKAQYMYSDCRESAVKVSRETRESPTRNL